MDRNPLNYLANGGPIVALRKESVDRNAEAVPAMTKQAQSLSARRAWIEILPSGRLSMLTSVALRKESVDRNLFRPPKKIGRLLSLSARRAWIEMILPPVDTSSVKSLSARRAWIEMNSLSSKYAL